MFTRSPLIRSFKSETALVLSAALLIAPTANAEDDLLVGSSNKDGIIDEITVSATRSERSSFAFPGSVTVIDQDQINDRVASNIADLFDAVPGVQFNGGPRRTGFIPSVRGASAAGTLILIDGVRQNFLSGHDGRFFIDPSLLTAAEVVRGPASSVYGSGALGGVISFRTLNAGDRLGDGESLGVQVRSGFQGVNDEIMAGATVFGRSTEHNLDAVASLTWRNSGDIALGDGNSLQSDDDLGSGLLKLTWSPSDALRLSGEWVAFRGDSIEPNNGQALNVGDLVDKSINSDLFRAGLDFTPEGQKLIDLSVVGYYGQTNVEEAELDSDRVINRTVETLGFVVDNRSTFEFSEGAKAVLTLGGEFYADEQQGTDTQALDGSRGGVPDAEAETFGLFAQLEIDLETPVGALSIIPSIRYDDFTNEAVGAAFTTDESAWNPRIGVSYQPTDWLLLFGAWGESFRAPSFNEIFADGRHFTIPLGPFVEAPNFFIPNENLRPEQADTFEFGAGVDFTDVFTNSDRVTLKGTYYESNVQDLIDLDVNVAFSPACFAPIPFQVCNAGTSQNVNTTNADLNGFELEAGYDNDRVFARAAFSSIDGVDTDTGRFVGVLTPDRFNLNAGIKLPEVDGRIGVRTEIAAEFDAVNADDEIRPAYETFDIYAVWQPSEGALKGLRVDLGVDNVTDAEAQRIFAGVPDPGRNWKANISWTSTF